MDGLNIKKWNGLHNTISVERMEPGDLTAGVNVLLRDDGRLTRRMGMIERQATLPGSRMHSLWTDGNVNGLCVRGRSLCSVHPSTFALTPIATLTADGPLAYAGVDGLVYWSNGTDLGVVQEGRNRSWGMTAPLLPAHTLTPGSMPPGTYMTAMTFRRADGQESGPSPVEVTTLTASRGLLWAGLDVSTDLGVTHKSLWLTATDGEVLYRAATVANTSTTAQYSGDTTELAEAIETMHLQPPPAGQALAFYAGRMWVARDEYIFGSQPFSAELFDLREYLPARGRVTMLAPRPDDKAMLVGTDAGVGWVTGGDLATMEYAHALDDPVLPGSLVYVPGEAFGDGDAGQTMIPMWIGESGVYAAAPPYWTVQPITLDRVDQRLRGRVAAVFDKARGQYLANIST